jgi:hypothetical protein
MAFDLTVTDLDFTDNCFEGILCIKDKKIGRKSLDNGQERYKKWWTNKDLYHPITTMTITGM